MVVAIDNADPNDMNNVHPKNKQEIGRRLALAAEAIAYGENIAYSGPIYEKMKIEGNTIRLYFKHTNGGLVAKDAVLKGFAIAGEDKKFVWANAKIGGIYYCFPFCDHKTGSCQVWMGQQSTNKFIQ